MSGWKDWIEQGKLNLRAAGKQSKDGRFRSGLLHSFPSGGGGLEGIASAIPMPTLQDPPGSIIAKKMPGEPLSLLRR